MRLTCGYNAMRVFFASDNLSSDSIIWHHHWEDQPINESEDNRSKERVLSIMINQT